MEVTSIKLTQKLVKGPKYTIFSLIIAKFMNNLENYLFFVRIYIKFQPNTAFLQGKGHILFCKGQKRTF